MRWAYPWALWVVWIIPLIIGIYVWYAGWKKKMIAVFGNTHTINRLISSEIAKRSYVKAIMAVSAVIFLWIALAGPQLGARLVEVHRRGIDVLIAIDCSKSMLAEDIKPNRLTRAKLSLTSLIQALEGDRVGIIAFAGTAFLQCPLTLDYSAAKMFLDFIDVNLIPRPGTAIGDAIRLAIKSFSRKERKHKILVLITDGEDHNSGPLEAAAEARREGIKIITVGIGSPEGEPIPVRDTPDAVQGYLKDASGNIVMSKLDENTLQKIALETGGTYFRAESGPIEIEGIIKEIQGMEKKELQSRLYNQYENRYQFFLLLAVICMMLECMIPEMGPIVSMKKIGVVLVIFSLSTSFAHASVRSKVNKGNSLYNNGKFDEALEVYKDAQIDDPESPLLHFNTGDACYRAGDFEKSYEEYQKALESKDINIQSHSYYNMGNALYRQGKLPESILHYKKALDLNDKDEDAKYNIEFVQKKIKEMADKNKNQSPQQNQQQQSQQNKQNPDNQEKNKPSGQDQKQGGDKKEESSDKEKQEKKPKPGSMNKEDAERLLNSLDDQEKEAQKKRMMTPRQSQGIVEDW